jgi:hypothetical protein
MEIKIKIELPNELLEACRAFCGTVQKAPICNTNCKNKKETKKGVKKETIIEIDDKKFAELSLPEMEGLFKKGLKPTPLRAKALGRCAMHVYGSDKLKTLAKSMHEEGILGIVEDDILLTSFVDRVLNQQWNEKDEFEL